MRSLGRRAWVPIVFSFLAAGCQPADRYELKPAAPKEAETPKPAAEPAKPEKVSDLAWAEPNPAAMEPEVPLVFVSRDKDPAGWGALGRFWTRIDVPAPALLGLPRLPAGALVKIKVPLGLPDPTDHLPPANRPTLGKWELGRRLFFDANVLFPPKTAQFACVTCHRPERGYGGGSMYREAVMGKALRAPTLLNGVYGKVQFGDGRAGSLEEVVYRPADLRRQEAGRDDLHAWGGVAGRLRDKADYDAQFKRVFGSPPTEDAVGKALATYLRTLLSGGSLQDRAEQARRDRGGKVLEPADYEKVLDKSALDALNRLLEKEAVGAEKFDAAKKGEAARRVYDGYVLFHGKGRCADCHGGPTYADNGFHNLGPDGLGQPPERGREPGRFAQLPIGLKDWNAVGAWKTPTLRSLSNRSPYLHDATRPSLFEAIWAHLHRGLFSPRSAPRLRGLELSEEELTSLVFFLLALDGEPVDAAVAAPPK